MMINYFAYGSNMLPSRLFDRDIAISSFKPVKLQHYELTFNKKSKKDPKVGFANIVPKWGSSVEGVLFQMEESELIKLDKFEGYPEHYQRLIVGPIIFTDEIANNTSAITYVSTVKYSSKENLPVTEQYASYLIKGSMILSEAYRTELTAKMHVNI